MALARKSSMSTLPRASQAVTTTRIPAMLAVAGLVPWADDGIRSEEHTSELQSHRDLHSFPTRRSSDLVFDVDVTACIAGGHDHAHTGHVGGRGVGTVGRRRD